MRRGPSRTDELVALVLPRTSLPAHLRPSQLLDPDVVPPERDAAKVNALRELVRSGGRPDDIIDTPVTSSAAIAAYYVPRLRDDTVESLHVVGLDARSRARFAMCVCRGGITSCAVHPRDLLRPLVLNAVVAACIVHNHPSGDPSPSPEDVALTERVAKAADVLGIRLLDHVVIGRNAHFSFLDAGLLPRR